MKVPPKPARALTPELITNAALRLVEEEGLAALSARRLAARLGCEAMSLYNHIGNMDGLKDAMVDRLLASLPDVKAGRAGMEQAALAFLNIAAQHPNAFVLVATRRWRTPGAIAAAQAMIAGLLAAGAEPREALRRARVLGAYLNGAALALTAWYRETDEASRSESAQVRADLDQGVALLLESLWPSEDDRS